MRYIVQIRDLLSLTQKKNQEIQELKNKIEKLEKLKPQPNSPSQITTNVSSTTNDEKYKKLEKEVVDLTEGIELLYESESRLMETNRELQNEIEVLQSTIDELQTNKNTTNQKGDDQEIKKLKNENFSLRETISRINQDLQDAASQKEEINELNAMITMLSNEVETLKASENRKRATKQRKNPKKREKDSDAMWKLEMKKLQDEVNLLQEREKARVRSSTNLSKKDANLHLQIETLSSQLYAVKSELSGKNIAFTALSKENEILQKQLDENIEKVKFISERYGNDSTFDKEVPLPSLGAIADRLRNLDDKHTLHCCTWRQLGLVLQAKMEPDADKRNTLFSKARWH